MIENNFIVFSEDSHIFTLPKPTIMPSKTILVVSQQNFIFFVEKEKIVYCQSDNCYTSLYLSDGRNLLLVKSLAKVIREDLNDDDFIRINQSYLINKKFIVFIDKKKKHVELINDIRIPFTKSLKDLLQLISLAIFLTNLTFCFSL